MAQSIAFVAVSKRTKIYPTISRNYIWRDLIEPSLPSKSFAEKGGVLPNTSILILSRTHQIWLRELKALLSSTPKLETLECGFEHDAEPSNGPSPFFDCEDLRLSLEPVRSTLKHLTLSFMFTAETAMEVDAGGSFENGYAGGLKGKIGCLRDFERLEMLEIPIAILFGWSIITTTTLSQILPQSLRSLVLRQDLSTFWEYKWCFDAIHNKLQQSLPSLKETPKLTALIMRAPPHLYLNEGQQAKWKDLDKKYAQAGVPLKSQGKAGSIPVSLHFH